MFVKSWWQAHNLVREGEGGATGATAAAPAAGIQPAATPPAGTPPANVLLETPPPEAKTPEQIAAEAAAAKTPEQLAAEAEAAAKAAKPMTAADYKLPEGLPEGVDAKDPLVAPLLDAAAKAGVSNEALGAILSELAPKVQEQLAAPYKAWNELQTKWGNEIKSDKDIGGAKLPETVARIMQGVKQFGDEAAVTEALRITGAGNNPAIIRLLNSVFSRLAEGSPVAGAPAQQGKSAAQKLYDHSSNPTPTST